MDSEQSNEVGFSDDMRKELIEYYKWIVNLAIFVFTLSISLIGLFGQGLRYSTIFAIGWILMAICIFVNWLIIKRLISLPIVLSVPTEEMGFLHRLFLQTLGNLKKYGFVQNWSFLLGVLAISLGLVLNYFR